jgi:hypothetical protein
VTGLATPTCLGIHFRSPNSVARRRRQEPASLADFSKKLAIPQKSHKLEKSRFGVVGGQDHLEAIDPVQSPNGENSIDGRTTRD